MDLTVTTHAAHYYYPTTPEQAAQQTIEPQEADAEKLPNNELQPIFCLNDVRASLSLTKETMAPYMSKAFQVISKYTHNNLGFIPTKEKVTRHIIKNIQQACSEGGII